MEGFDSETRRKTWKSKTEWWSIISLPTSQPSDLTSWSFIQLVHHMNKSPFPPCCPLCVQEAAKKVYIYSSRAWWVTNWVSQQVQVEAGANIPSHNRHKQAVNQKPLELKVHEGMLQLNISDVKSTEPLSQRRRQREMEGGRKKGSKE